MKLRFHILSLFVVRTLLALCVAGAASTTFAAGVVGMGSAASCTDAALNTALAAGGLVSFNCGPAAVTIDISGGTGTKMIAADTTIDGGGLITISGGNHVIVFSVNTGVTFTVQNLTIANGLGGYGGGGISNGGTLTVTNSTLSGNAAYQGGGIYNIGTVIVTNSTFASNSARESAGGGIYNDGGTLILTNCTLSGNSAEYIFNQDSYGGGIYNDNGTLTLTNCTLTGNSAGPGGASGIHNNADSGGTVTVGNTIISNRTGWNCRGPVQSAGYNLDSNGSCGFANTGDVSNVPAYLSPLGDYGGPTQTHALCTGPGMPHPDCVGVSPAIDAGDQAICAAAPVNNRDQRGFGRPGTGHTHCSIGAYEADGSAPAPCAGDCDAGGAVAIDELIMLVNITLGDAQPSACPNGNPSGAEVDIALIVQAVNTALSGCPASDLYVAASGALNGDGSVANPYRRITDAVVRARAARQTGAIPPQEEIRIHVAPGTYIGSFGRAALQDHPEYEVLPIILNVSKLAARGSTILVRDDRGLPTGTESGSETIVEPDQPLRQSQSLFLVTGTTDGAVGNGVAVEGFVLDGREGRDFNNPLFVERVSDFRISDNLIQHGSFGVTTRLASGTIEGNLLIHNSASGALVGGGSIAQPATVLLHANRVTGNAKHGLIALAVATNNALLRGSNPLDLQPPQTKFDRNNPEHVQNIPDTLAVTLSGNDISDTKGFGIRLVAAFPEGGSSVLCIGRMGYETQDDTQPLTGVLTAHVLDNTISLSGYAGVGMEAGFTCRSDPRAFVVTFAGSFASNSFAASGHPAALFDFGYAGVSPSLLSTFGFTRASTYDVTDADGELAGFDYNNPLIDLLDGAVLNNTLRVNGVEVPHGVSVTPKAAGVADGTQ